MTDLELLKQRLIEVKDELEEKGKFLGAKASNTDELMDALPSMKEYEYRFQNVIEDIWPDKAWWQMTNYWDIFQDSIMSGKTADEVIEDIMNHIVIEEEVEDEPIKDESLEESVDKILVSDSIIDIFSQLDSFGE